MEISPNPIQLLAPPLTIPIPGIKTIINNSKDYIIIIFLYFWYKLASILITIKKIDNPIRKKISCLIKKYLSFPILYPAQIIDELYTIKTPMIAKIIKTIVNLFFK